METSAIKVLCVDDNPMIGEAVALKLGQSEEFEVIGQLYHAGDLVAEATRSQPEVVLLDIDMPGKDPFEAIIDLAEAGLDARVIMLSGLVRRDLIDKAFEAGAWGYLAKSDVETLPDAIRQVVAGSIALGPDVQALMD